MENRLQKRRDEGWAMAKKADALFGKGEWEELAALALELPERLEGPWLRVADSSGFALGRLKRFEEAARVFERAWDVEPTHRRASALAYQAYGALLEDRNARRDAKLPEERREHWKKEFRRWIAEALRLVPNSVADLYRLGEFEAQIESCHDKVALRAFLGAIRAYRELEDPTGERRARLRRYYCRALYCAARSAMRLGDVAQWRRLSFTCVREDPEGRFVERIYSLHLAAKACIASGELDAAERGLRLALDAKGPPRRDFLFAQLAVVQERRGDLPGAIRWIEAHVPPHRRDAPLWRQLGDLRRAAGDLQGARGAYRSSLQRDRAGRHLTLTRLGDLLREEGQFEAAIREYRKALEFRRRTYLGQHLPALDGLRECLRRLGREAEAAELDRRVEAAAHEGRAAA
jgi:tetratricopeptide (TPR) repeat protein